MTYDDQGTLYPLGDSLLETIVPEGSADRAPHRMAVWYDIATDGHWIAWNGRRVLITAGTKDANRSIWRLLNLDWMTIEEANQHRPA